MSYGAKIDGVTDDTEAWKAAIADVGRTNMASTIYIPNTGKETLVSDTLRIYSSNAQPLDGLVLEGDGGVPNGIHGMSSSLTWNGQQVRGTEGCSVKKYTNGLRLQGLKGLLGTAQVGDILEIWGARNYTNNGRFPILEITSDTECVIWNQGGVAGETGLYWLLERYLIDLRVSGPTIKNLSLYARGNTYLTAYLKWTESQLPGVQPPTGIKIKDVGMWSDNIVIDGKYPIIRWGYVIGSQFVPQPGHTDYALDPDGFPVSFWPSNCDLGVYDCLITGYLEQGGVFWDSANGNDYAHTFYRCAFVNQPMGAYVIAPLSGQGNFYECGGGGIWDTVIQIGCSTLRTNIHGGHSEVCGTLFSSSSGMTVTNHTAFLGGTDNNGWTVDFGVGHPIGLAPTGDVISSFGSLIVDGCYFDGGPSFGTGQHCSINSPPGNMAHANIRGTTWGVNDFQKGLSTGVSPFTLVTTKRGPWKLADGQTLTFTMSVNGVSSTRTVTFHAADFRDISRCWPWEVAYAFQKDPAAAGITPWFRGDGTGLIFILANRAPKTSDIITFTGGTAAQELGLNPGSTFFDNWHVLGATLPEMTASNGTVICKNGTPLHLSLSGNSLYDKFLAKYDPIPEADLYFRTNDSFSDYAPAMRMLTPGPSMGTQACRNLGGVLRFYGTTARVLFNQDEIDPDYQLLFSGLSGSYWVNSQSKKGFQITVSEVPSQTATWMIYRPENNVGSDPVVFPTVQNPVLWVDAAYDAHTLEPSSVAVDNFPDSLRPHLTSIKDQVSGQLLQVVAGFSTCFRIDRDDQVQTSKTPNGWPYLHSCFNKKVGGLDLPSTSPLFPTDAFSILAVACIPIANSIQTSAPSVPFNINGVSFQYNSVGALNRCISYVGYTSFNDTKADAVPGQWELIEIHKTHGSAPRMVINGSVRTLTNTAYTTFTPKPYVHIGEDNQTYNLAFVAAWKSDISASVAPLRAALNARFKLF